MRDNLPKTVRRMECGIINLDDSYGKGTHWVAYWKNKSRNEYFDSFGNLQPPKELISYLGNNVNYNHKRYQDYNTYNCGHLCLKFLNEICNEKSSIQ